MQNKKTIITAVAAYLISAIVSYIAFTTFLPSNLSNLSPVPSVKKDASGKVIFDETLPKTQPCPLNGAKYSKQQEKWWEGHRPLGIMIENHVEARPQSGLSSADVIYEAIAEGGITRFLAVFYCNDAEFVGPVRSARTYFMDFLSDYGPNPLYAHVGGANTPGPADALGQISSYGWQAYNDLNQFSIGFPVYVRDYDRLGRTVATEHTVYSGTSKLWEYAAKNRKLTNEDEEGTAWDEKFVPWTFKEDAKVDARPASQSVSYEFWDGYGDFAVNWKYDKATNTYLRINGGKPHTDLNTKKQIAAKNVVVLFMKESRANDGYEGNLHMLYGTKGTGKALVFQDGEEINATWSKKDRTSRLLLKDNRGQDIEFNPGLIWFSVLAPNTTVSAQ